VHRSRALASVRLGWSLDQDEWTAIDAFDLDVKWKSIAFSGAHLRSVPERSGVYIITSHMPRVGEWSTASRHNPLIQLCTPLYIGISETSLRDRFTAHTTSPSKLVSKASACFSTGQIRYWWIEYPPENVREIENCLIRMFGPPANAINSIRGALQAPIPA
jgi:hypothetical protein